MRFAKAMGCLSLCAAVGWSQGPAPPTQASPSQPPVATLQVTTRVVAISAVVKNKTGEPVGGLTRDDFLLKEDGKEEPIRYFSQGSELPLTIALMVDTSGSQRTLIGDETLASDVFFQTMLGSPEDRAALIQFDARVLQLQALTHSAGTLQMALQGVRSDPAFAQATLLDDAVSAVATHVLSKQTGRKAMVLLTDGGDAGSRTPLKQAIEQAQRENIQIYSILYTARAFASPSGALRFAADDPGPETLRQLSESTGGHVFTVSATLGLREIFARISQDLRLQYELGYVPPSDVQPNSYHRLDLRTRQRGLTVQARKGFFAPR